jgi:hypothetical protein
MTAGLIGLGYGRVCVRCIGKSRSSAIWLRGEAATNVEEFQLALRDLVEGRPASQDVKPAAHTNGPEKMQTKKQ